MQQDHRLFITAKEVAKIESSWSRPVAYRAGRAYKAINLGANMHSARATTNIEREQSIQPYKTLPTMQLPQMFPPVALAAFNL